MPISFCFNKNLHFQILFQVCQQKMYCQTSGEGFQLQTKKPQQDLLINLQYQKKSQEAIKSCEQFIRQEHLFSDFNQTRYLREQACAQSQKISLLEAHNNEDKSQVKKPAFSTLSSDFPSYKQFVEGIQTRKESKNSKINCFYTFSPEKGQQPIKKQTKCVKLDLQQSANWQQKQVGALQIIKKKRKQLITTKNDIDQHLKQLEKKVLKNNKLTKTLKEHLKKSPNHKVTFDIDGQLLLFYPKPPTNIQDHLTQNCKTLEPTSKRSELTSRYRSNRVSNGKKSKSQTLYSETFRITNPVYKNPFIAGQDNFEMERSTRTNERRKAFSNNQKRQTTNIPFFSAEKGIKYCQQTLKNDNYKSSFMLQNQSKNETVFSKKQSKFEKYTSTSKPEKRQSAVQSYVNLKQRNLRTKYIRSHPLIPKTYRNCKTQVDQKQARGQYFGLKNRISIKNIEVLQNMLQN